MRRSTLKYLATACAAFGLAACKDSTSPLTLATDAAVQADVAASAGDAASSEASWMIANETAAALPSSQPSSFSVLGSPPISETFTFTRTKVCLDANNVEVLLCSPLSSVRKVATHLTLDGSRQGTYFTGAVHRVADDTTTRVLNMAASADSLRIHSGVAISHDTTTFADATASGSHAENATDSVNAVTWRIPRSSNPFPISGSFVRNVAVHATYTKNNVMETRDLTKRVEIDFPADAQGNVVLKIDAKTCNLNLVTHVVSGCH
jgi:hypothetical protein